MRQTKKVLVKDIVNATCFFGAVIFMLTASIARDVFLSRRRKKRKKKGAIGRFFENLRRFKTELRGDIERARALQKYMEEEKMQCCLCVFEPESCVSENDRR